MSSTVDLEIVYRIANAPLRTFPFPHLYVPEIFPAAYYAEALRSLPAPEAMTPLEQAGRAKGYPERSIMPLGGELPAGLGEAQRSFWTGFGRTLLGGRLAHAVLQKFESQIQQQLSRTPDFEIFDEAMLVHDRTRFALGPHSDSPKKLASLLFYMPADLAQARYGTSVYVPRDPSFTCPGGPHHAFADFERVATMPFAPNSLFAFPKSAVSFHGVEPIDEPGVARWLTLYDLRLKVLEQPAPGAPARTQFSF
jgi:hypothetical protein